MTRLLYDSTNPLDIPDFAAVVAGYVDGFFRWSDEGWARFPNAVKVRIAVLSSTDDGQVGDVERGAMTVDGALEWTKRRRAAGVDPTLYASLGLMPQIASAFAAANEPLPHLWVARYDGVAELPDGYVAKQYADGGMLGYHYDLSVVADYWPGVDDMTPEQSAKLDRILALLEAREPLVWIARLQRALDVETGKPFDPAKPPLDPRIRT